MNRRRSGFHASSRRQEGVALVVVLLMLMVVTLLGLASMRGAILQERMAGATIGRSMAFQAAEAALRQGEAVAADERKVPPASGCQQAFCARTAVGVTPAWKSDSFWDDTKATTNFRVATATNGTTSKFSIEDYGLATSPDCAAAVGENPFDMSAPTCTAEIRVYRVIARSRTESGSEVVLQSLFRAP